MGYLHFHPNICTEIMASRIAARFASRRMFSSSGKVLGEEEKAAENVFIKKMEHEKLEKLARKGPKLEEPVTTVADSATNANSSTSASSSSEGSSNKFRNYAVMGSVVAGFGALGWYLNSTPKKSETQA